MNTDLMAFPEPPETMQLALINLALLGRGGEGAAGFLASAEVLPRPWDITTIADPDLRQDTWRWLDAFVIWLNSQHAWFSSDLTPPCWASHPNLVHQLGTLAATRHHASESTDPTAMEEWHRYALPNYLERTREQRHGCQDKHQPWPARATHIRQLGMVDPPLTLRH